ncbi:MAG: hypothetical protein PVG98_15580 [Chromatiales bacterium]
MRKEIAWISPLRTGVIYAAIIAVLYAAAIVLMLILAALAGGPHSGEFGGFGGFGGAGRAEMMLGVGLLRSLFGLIPAMIGGFLAGLISAAVYNIAAAIAGGIVIELRDR